MFCSCVLDEPFLVLATQNPIEQEGTYPLPEAQVDRFLFKLKVGYPQRDEEREIMRKMARSHPNFDVNTVMTPADILRLRDLVDEVFIDEKIEEYILDLITATREPKAFDLGELDGFIRYGASPRATIYLAMAAKGRAFLCGRGYVSPQDIKCVGMDVLRHRLIVTYEAEAQKMTSEDILKRIFNTVHVP